ncbi:hypothetical protein LPW11_16555 [Geomonas sp. RF6]|uniref:hypothetical protein n=1 Tax=Geomonas sp. RF6 TaxID=2897342 RepID=UPI001E449AC1|nr:hypothetical protein [Geomonas sp. RF6]UFS69499.1 hypothetical protein LPW11_16555 [Geomonas sp. RF6]
MFALNTALKWIEEAESDVLEIFQSDPLSVSLNGSKPEKRTAYVCAVKKKTKVQVYVAFTSRHGESVIYTRTGANESVKNYGESVEEGIGFARSMGFALEPVNLDYSPALREVVLQGLKIFTPPRTFAKNERVKDAPYASPQDISEVVPPAPQSAPISPPSAAPVPAGAVAAIAPVAAGAAAAAVETLATVATLALLAEEKKESEQERSAQALEELRKELEKVGSERDDLSAQVHNLSALQQTSAAELTSAQAANLQLAAEREKLAQRLEEVSAETTALREEAALLARQRVDADRCNKAFVEETRHRVEQEGATAKLISDLRDSLEAVTAENQALSAKVQEVSAGQAHMAAELEKAERERKALTEERDKLAQSVLHFEGTSSELTVLQEEAALLRTERDETERRNKELEQENAALASAAATAKQEAADLAVERDAAVKRATEITAEKETASAGTDTLRETVAALTKERAAALSRLRKLQEEASAKDAELEALRVEIAALRAGQETLHEAAAERSQRLEKIEAELEESQRLLDQMQRQQGAATAPPESPSGILGKEEASATEAAGGGDRYHAFVEPAGAGEWLSAMPAMPVLLPPEAADFSAPDGGSFFPSFSEEGGAPVLFLLERGRTAIEYEAPDDVVEVHRSTNFASIAPDGKGQESCQGFICSVKEGSGVRIYVALHGKQSGKTTVYKPETESADDGSVAAIFAGAVSFAEQVGLMMEPLKFRSPQQRTEFIGQCPVLKRREQCRPE